METLNIKVLIPPNGRKMRCEDIRRPIQQVAEAMLKSCRLKPYQIQQALESLEVFWTGIHNRTRKLEDYADYFKEK